MCVCVRACVHVWVWVIQVQDHSTRWKMGWMFDWRLWRVISWPAASQSVVTTNPSFPLSFHQTWLTAGVWQPCCVSLSRSMPARRASPTPGTCTPCWWQPSGPSCIGSCTDRSSSVIRCVGGTCRCVCACMCVGMWVWVGGREGVRVHSTDGRRGEGKERS